MQDRVFSRQRYRGEPFPIVWTPDGKAIALDEKELPITLPDVENYEPTGTTEGPLANIDERVNITLPDGTKAKRETNTMPGRAGSSRYRLRYMDPKNNKQLVSPEREKYRGSVDVYVGGAEHVTRHMIYARFWQKFLYDIGTVTHDEPFQEYHYVGLIMAEDGRKMSKRRGNTIDPDTVINEFGHDTFRVYEMFMGPFDQAIARSTNGVK
jgi:leucyl-tRNA synthetase